MIKSAFTIPIVLRPGIWPPPRLGEVAAIPHEDFQVRLLAYPDGHLEVTVAQVGEPPAHRMHFQRLQLTDPPGWMLLILEYANGELTLEVNRQNLLRLSQAQGDEYVVPPNQPRPSDPISLEHPEASLTCSERVAIRRERFALREQRSVRGGRRPKSVAEQHAELEEARKALTDHRQAVLGGAPHLIPSLAATLRALTYWPNDGPTWSPLLFRLADRAQLPLPVYAERIDEDHPASRLDFNASYHASSASLRRRYPGDHLMDVEDYLDMPAQIRRADDDTGGRVVQQRTVGELVGSAASSLGAAHYDDTIDLEVEAYRSLVAFETSQLHRLIIDLSEVVEALAEFVMARLPSASEDEK